jgi:hypothetical protein
MEAFFLRTSVCGVAVAVKVSKLKQDLRSGARSAPISLGAAYSNGSIGPCPSAARRVPESSANTAKN